MTQFGGVPQRWKDPAVPMNQKVWSFGGVNNMQYTESDDSPNQGLGILGEHACLPASANSKWCSAIIALRSVSGPYDVALKPCNRYFRIWK
jgi:hypothetical protein